LAIKILAMGWGFGVLGSGYARKPAKKILSAQK
jgi:hypothetical protein